MKVSRIILNATLIIGLLAAVSMPASANSSGNGSIQGYGADAPLNNGTIVQLANKDGTKVASATQGNVQNMFGVTVDRGQLLISSSGDGYANEAYVAVSGTHDVLVSTQGGAIHAGDYVTISSIDGIAMKADTTQKTVFGRAGATFDGKGVTLGTETLTDKATNTKQTVVIGMIPVTINIERNPNIKSTKVDVPQWLERLGQQIAEKQVSPIRIYISLAITGVSLITAIIVLYAGIRNGIISIGRNPMSKKSIFRALLEIILTSILILVIGLFAVYLLLKL